MEVSAERISQVYKGLSNAKIALFQLGERELAAKEALKIKEAMLLATPGAIIGKNAETRDAQLREGCCLERLELELARAARAKTQLEFDLATMAVDELKLLIRLDELASMVCGE